VLKANENEGFRVGEKNFARGFFIIARRENYFSSRAVPSVSGLAEGETDCALLPNRHSCAVMKP
jgi:hypothetical protein